MRDFLQSYVLKEYQTVNVHIDMVGANAKSNPTFFTTSLSSQTDARGEILFFFKTISTSNITRPGMHHMGTLKHDQVMWYYKHFVTCPSAMEYMQHPMPNVFFFFFISLFTLLLMCSSSLYIILNEASSFNISSCQSCTKCQMLTTWFKM